MMGNNRAVQGAGGGARGVTKGRKRSLDQDAEDVVVEVENAQGYAKYKAHRALRPMIFMPWTAEFGADGDVVRSGNSPLEQA